MTNNAPVRDAGRPSSPSVGKALVVLNLLMSHPNGLGITDISRALNYPKSSLYSVLHTMQELEFLAKDPINKRYTLGPQLLIIGAMYARNNGLLTLFRKFAQQLSDATGETVQLAMLQNRDALYIGKLEGSQLIRLASDVGTRLPAHATSLGKCLLAGLTDQQLEQLYNDVEFEKLTSSTIDNLTDLSHAVASVRRLGYAEDQGEALEGVHCFGAPILDANGNVVAAISVSVPLVRLSDDRRTELVERISSCAAQISHHLGFNAEGSSSSGDGVWPAQPPTSPATLKHQPG